jgi:hypothetical protein
MSNLATVSHVIGPEQDADFTVQLGFSASSGAPWSTGNTVRGQVPPQIIAHAFLRVDVAIDRFLADPLRRLFLDHPIADLFGRPSVFDPLNHTFAEFRVFDQFAISGAPVCCHQLGSGTVVAFMFGHAFI